MKDFKEENEYVDIIYKNKELLYEINSKIGQNIKVYDNNFFGKILVIDNDLQLTEHDESNYHEMMVHVPLNYMENNIKILIIGGGDGGTLREVCKHNNVSEIIMIEIDIEVINISKKYFKKCSKSFNDKRLKLIIQDAAVWLKDNLIKYTNYFDVILLDSTDFNKSNTLITDEFYINIDKVLNYYGIFCFNCLSLLWEKEGYDEVMEEMENFFDYTNLYQLYQPTYSSGNYTFCINSDYIDFINTPINVNKYKEKNIKCTYYNIDIHKSSFCLQNEFIKQLNKDKRLGTNYMIDIKKCSSDKLNDLELLTNLLRTIIKLFNLTEIEYSYYKFKPQGLTINILLKESHITIHTWPEKKKCTIDLFTCSNFKWNFNFNSSNIPFILTNNNKQIIDKFDLRHIINYYLNVSFNNIKVNWHEREL